MSWETAAIIITALAGIFGLSFWAKSKLIVKEIREAFSVLEEAMSDDKITADEARKVVKEFVDIGKIFLRK